MTERIAIRVYGGLFRAVARRDPRRSSPTITGIHPAQRAIRRDEHATVRFVDLPDAPGRTGSDGVGRPTAGCAASWPDRSGAVIAAWTGAGGPGVATLPDVLPPYAFRPPCCTGRKPRPGAV
jgi:hypothetical protein